MHLIECYPPGEKNRTQLFCKKYFNKNNAILDANDLSAENDKDAHRPKSTIATKQTKPKGKVKRVAEKSGDLMKYKVFDYVMAK